MFCPPPKKPPKYWRGTIKRGTDTMLILIFADWEGKKGSRSSGMLRHRRGKAREWKLCYAAPSPVYLLWMEQPKRDSKRTAFSIQTPTGTVGWTWSKWGTPEEKSRGLVLSHTPRSINNSESSYQSALLGFSYPTLWYPCYHVIMQFVSWSISSHAPHIFFRFNQHQVWPIQSPMQI